MNKAEIKIVFLKFDGLIDSVEDRHARHAWKTYYFYHLLFFLLQCTFYFFVYFRHSVSWEAALKTSSEKKKTRVSRRLAVLHT